MLEEEYERSRRRPPAHLRRTPPPEPPFAFDIRPALAADIPDIRAIHTHYVTNSVVTLESRPWTLDAWRDTLTALDRMGLPFLVAASPGGHVLGFALAQPWGSASESKYSVETSIYLGPGATGKGLGRALLDALVEACRARGLRRMVALVSDSSADASLALHARAGFVEVGRMGRVGFKFDRWLGTIQLERALRPERRRWSRPSWLGGRRGEDAPG